MPIGVALVFGLLLAPRRPEPVGIPRPIADPRGMERAIDSDRALAEAGRREPLSSSVRALGSAIRDFHVLEADQESDLRTLGQARHAVDVALLEAMKLGPEPSFACGRWSKASRRGRQVLGIREQSPELKALAGGFVRSMTNEGWCEGHTLAAAPAVLRVLFKQMWDAFLGLDRRDGSVPSDVATALALSLDEERTLYAFYLSHLNSSRGARDATPLRERPPATPVPVTGSSSPSGLPSTRGPSTTSPGSLPPIRRTWRTTRGGGAVRTWGVSGVRRVFQKRVSDDHPDGLVERAQNYLRAAAEADRLE